MSFVFERYDSVEDIKKETKSKKIYNNDKLTILLIVTHNYYDSIEDIKRENGLIKITIYDNYNLFTVIIVTQLLLRLYRRH